MNNCIPRPAFNDNSLIHQHPENRLYTKNKGEFQNVTTKFTGSAIKRSTVKSKIFFETLKPEMYLCLFLMQCLISMYSYCD